MRRTRRENGFTLVELMMVVALIGVLAAVAIPQFMTYQARTRRSEAFLNLQAVASMEKGYFAERDVYFETLNAFPDWTSYGGLGTDKMPWDAASENAFADLGWIPEGQVYHGYEVNATGPGCTCSICFTATAHGDVDGDGVGSSVMYVEPEIAADGSKTECPSRLFAFGTPTQFGSGQPVYGEVAVNRETDEF